MLALILLASLYMGWNIGANDAANCVGADIGSGEMTLRQGIFITSLFGLLGALFFGSRVTKTIGRGIIPLHQLDPSLSLLVALIASLSAAIWVTFSTFRKIPVSTSQSIVGAVAGSGLAIGVTVAWRKLLDIVICWVLTPLSGALIAFILYFILKNVFLKVIPQRFQRRIIRSLIFLTSMYLAFNWGANDVANSTGLIIGSGILSSPLATLIGGLAIVIGIYTWGYRVIETVGFRITRLLPLMTVAVEMASAINVNLFTLWGIPVSTSQSIVGAVCGVGLFTGERILNKKLVGEIAFTWLITPLVSGVIAFILLCIFTKF